MEASASLTGQSYLWCHIHLKRSQACNVASIERLALDNIGHLHNCKVVLRGRGSNNLEVDDIKEAPVPLMVAVSVNHAGDDAHHFETAVEWLVSYLSEKACSWRFAAMSKAAEERLMDCKLLGTHSITWPSRKPVQRVAEPSNRQQESSRALSQARQ
jgi:hypothetical protein